MTITSTIVVGDAIESLREMPDASAHCCVTSPPYWGLRDYGVDGQIGLEETPEAYVSRLVEVFREVRRVLRDDGTLWLNLGDSYAGSWGAQGRQGKTGQLAGRSACAARQIAAGHKRLERTGSLDRTTGLKPKDLVGIPWRVARALQEPYYTGAIKNESNRVWLAAMIDGEGCIFIHKRKAGQENGQGYVRKNDSYGSGLEVSNTSRAIVERCLEIVGKGSICRQEAGTHGRKQTIFRWNLRSNECRNVLREVYPYLVGKRHEARLAIGCPSSGADAERAHESLKGLHNGETPSIDFPEPASMFEPGWLLRSDIIWSKCNPMPESVTDRPTKAHEYVFLLAKSDRYHYDAKAIAEPVTCGDHPRNGNPDYEQRAPGQPRQEGITRRRRSGNKSRSYGGGVGDRPNDHLGRGVPWEDRTGTRNSRTVWTIPSHPFAEAHFATMPPALAKRCVLAGCPAGGTVLDPFSGAGTTGLVAVENGCSFVGVELNPEYAEMGRRRIAPALAQGKLFS